MGDSQPSFSVTQNQKDSERVLILAIVGYQEDRQYYHCENYKENFQKLHPNQMRQNGWGDREKSRDSYQERKSR